MDAAAAGDRPSASDADSDHRSDGVNGKPSLKNK